MDKMLKDMKAQKEISGHKNPQTKNTFSPLISSFSEILEGRSQESLAMIPSTPAEIKAAKARLQKPIENYKCSICNDTEFVHPVIDGKPDYTKVVSCQCVRAEKDKKKQDALVSYCEIPEKGQQMTFDNFTICTGNRYAFDICLAIAKGESEYNFITLLGKTTRGKTHLAMAICNYRLKEKQPAKYTYVPLLLEELKAGFKKDGDDSYLSRYNVLLNVPLLLLDDLGVENATPWAQEKLDTLVDYRLMHKLTTVVTTNLQLNEVSFRIRARLKRDGKIVPITGDEFGGPK